MPPGKEYPQSPIAKVCRAKYNWVAQTDGGRFTRAWAMHPGPLDNIDPYLYRSIIWMEIHSQIPKLGWLNPHFYSLYHILIHLLVTVQLSPFYTYPNPCYGC